eukprot:gb/GEZN01003756.1/.p1 GENE.gb/GEZN01003756.1/~~gb/GEZN01003756.1/.p1  ORF type:complete len:511 (+),score=66.14 gb/GEZN01003756.1/:570-2102(+)
MRDLCVQAPTGSGKTLAYVLPIIQHLCERIVRRLRAVVILPTRDLAAQVHSVFQLFCRPLGLQVELAVGQRGFASEQAALVGTSSLDPINQSSLLHTPDYTDLADILVCTPGRLVDHLQATAGFQLHHVRYLVLDEADRLIMQRYQNWTEKVFQAIAAPQRGEIGQGQAVAAPQWGESGQGGNNAVMLEQGSMFESLSLPICRPETLPHTLRSCQKFLFSATLTSNPQQLAKLTLADPLLFVATTVTSVTTADATPTAVTSFSTVKPKRKRELPAASCQPLDSFSSKFRIPSTLTEQLIITDLPQKPLVLIHLLRTHPTDQVLLFTSSLEASHRLNRLLEIFGGFSVAKFSSDLPQDLRSKVIRRFRRGVLRVLVCSDAMARGMDLENVNLIINYDVPVHIKTYLHRVGRTARANQDGVAITLLQKNQASYFRSLLGQALRAEGKKPQEVRIEPATMEALLPMYVLTLSALRSVLADEQQNLLGKTRGLSQEQQTKYRAEAAAAAKVISQ